MDHDKITLRYLPRPEVNDEFPMFMDEIKVIPFTVKRTMLFMNTFGFYSTKREALEALATRLNELLDETD